MDDYKIPFTARQIDYDISKFCYSFDCLYDTDDVNSNLHRKIFDKNDHLIKVIGGYVSVHSGEEIDDFIRRVLNA